MKTIDKFKGTCCKKAEKQQKEKSWIESEHSYKYKKFTIEFSKNTTMLKL
ncbi:MAG: hypothetical protein RLZ91_1448, partial [Bacteroidota bacterium]